MVPNHLSYISQYVGVCFVGVTAGFIVEGLFGLEKEEEDDEREDDERKEEDEEREDVPPLEKVSDVIPTIKSKQKTK